MLKLFIISLGLLVSITGFSEEGKILIRDKVVNLGRIMGDEITTVDKEIVLVRDDQSPNIITLKLDYDLLKKSCVEYEIKSKAKSPVVVNSCDQVASGSSKEVFECSKKKFEGFDVLKRVCSKKGRVLKAASKKIKVVFIRSVALAPGAKEELSLKINQKKISSSALKVEGRVENSSSLYKVNNLFNSVIEFKAK